MPSRSGYLARTLLVVLGVAGAVACGLPAVAQEISHRSVCHPEGGDTFPTGDTIFFRYDSPDPPGLPKDPVLTYPPCVDVTLTADGVAGKPPFSFTWTGPDGRQWSGNPVTVNTGDLDSGISTLVLEVANNWGKAVDSVNLSIPRLAGPLPAPIADAAPSPDLQASFMASAEGAEEWMWDFGDGTTTAWATPCGYDTSVVSHTFPAAGLYAVVAYARNCRDGSVATAPLEIAVGTSNLTAGAAAASPSP